jgi:hypothetical protein
MKQNKINKKEAPSRAPKAGGKSVIKENKMDRSGFAFGKDNYKWLLICLGFLLVGYLLMIGGGSDDPDVFNDAMFDFQRWVLSPILLMIGYVIGIYAIMKKPKNTNTETN